MGAEQVTDAEPVVPTEDSKAPDSSSEKPKPIFVTPAEREVALAVMDVVAQYEVRPDLAPNRQALLKPEVQAAIEKAVKERLSPEQVPLPGVESAQPKVDLANVVLRAVTEVVKQTIDIPRIAVVPKGEVRIGFKPFTLDVSGINLQPKDRSLVGQSLKTGDRFEMSAQAGQVERRLEDYIVHALIDFDDIDYSAHASLLYDLAGQTVVHLRGYLKDEAELRSVLDLDRQTLARNIHAQMAAHLDDAGVEYTVEVRRGFTALKEPTFTVGAGQAVRNVRDTVDEPSRIKQMVFGHFSRCLYPLQKFDSDTERRFAVILERDSGKWFKPAKGQFQIFYKLKTEQPEYVPDFVAETDTCVLMVETKATKEVGSTDVVARAEAGAVYARQRVRGGQWRQAMEVPVCTP